MMQIKCGKLSRKTMQHLYSLIDIGDRVYTHRDTTLKILATLSCDDFEELCFIDLAIDLKGIYKYDVMPTGVVYSDKQTSTVRKLTIAINNMYKQLTQEEAS